MAEFVRMPSTMWTQISQARRQGGPMLEDLLAKYRPPILAFIRNHVASAEEAEDLTQDVFIRILKEDVLEKADKAAGRFRSLLLSVARHTVQTHKRDEHRLKRGGGRARADFEDRDIAEILAAPEEKDESFDPLWIQNLVRLAMEALAAESEKIGLPYHRALQLHVDQGLGYPEIAQELGKSVGDIKNYLHQARLRLKRHVADEIRGYSSSRGEYEAETAHLMKFLE